MCRKQQRPAWPERTETAGGQTDEAGDREGPDGKGPWKELALTWVMEIQCRAFDRGIIININCLVVFLNCFFPFLSIFKAFMF